MLKDTARIQAYKNAIFSCVEYFKDKIVMDVGAGTGRFRLWPAL
jgi:predicted RNA methylase